MKFATEELIQDLILRTECVIKQVQRYRELDPIQLNHKTHSASWSKLECLEHLNLYGDFYLPEMERNILSSPRIKVDFFKSGIIGNYFAKLMLPKPNGELKKMKSPVDKQPTSSQLSITTIDRFLKQQEQLLRLLELAKQVDLTKTKTAISISKMVRLRLGDTFRFYVYHIERHVIQAERIETVKQ